MKGAIACAVAAALDYLAAHGGKPKGSISFLITGDEEGIAVNGTVEAPAMGGRARREIRPLHPRRAHQYRRRSATWSRSAGAARRTARWW